MSADTESLLEMTSTYDQEVKDVQIFVPTNYDDGGPLPFGGSRLHTEPVVRESSQIHRVMNPYLNVPDVRGFWLNAIGLLFSERDHTYLG